MDKQLNQGSKQLKVTTHSTFSFCAHLGYMPSILSTFN